MPHHESIDTEGPNSSNIQSGHFPLTVYALGEYVFCPRAGLIARESDGTDSDEEMPGLGPNLGSFWDYSEHRFNEEISLAWGRMRTLTALLFGTLLLVALLGRFISPLAAAVGAVPMGYVLTHAAATLIQIFRLVWHRSSLRSAVTDISVFSHPVITQVNWWALRKAGFDCWKPQLPYQDPNEQLTGKPWRVLTQGTRVRIPVIRKHRGQSLCQPQHIVKLMAHCQLLEVCEGAESPFGILMFNDSAECVLIPNVREHREQLQFALNGFRRVLSLTKSDGLIPGIPIDQRCYGCHLGEPRLYIPQSSETVLEGIIRLPVLNGPFHSTCGDRFGWTPPHEGTLARAGR